MTTIIRSKQTGQLVVPLLANSLELAARSAFAEHVRLYDDADPIVVDVKPHQFQFIYISVRASRSSRSATFIQCRVDGACEQFWINWLQVANSRRRQGLGRQMVRAAEATAQEIGVSSVMVYPLTVAVDYWESLGYAPDASMSRVLQKRL